MGDFATERSSAQQKGSETTDVVQNPWGPQSNYLKDIFSKAQGTYNNVANVDPYTGDMIAGFRPEQIQQFNSMLGYANSSPAAQDLYGYGSNAAQAGQGAMNYGLSGLQGFNPMDTAGTIADAGMYADNPYLSSMVDAAMRDANRSTYEENIPQVRRQAALSGNTNSSRTGAREAILERGNMDRAADVSASLRGNAYDTGLQAAQSQRAMELARLGDVTSQGTNASALGTGNLSNSVATMRDLFGIGAEGGAGLRASDQASLDNEYAKWQQAQTNNQLQWDALNNYYNLVGNKNWGSQTKGTGTTNKTAQTETNPSLATILGGLATGVSGFLPA